MISKDDIKLYKNNEVNSSFFLLLDRYLILAIKLLWLRYHKIWKVAKNMIKQALTLEKSAGNGKCQ